MVARSTACCAALSVCSAAALLLGAGHAAAATTTRLPLGQSFTALEVSSTGQAWVTSARRGLGRGAWAVVDGTGRLSWHPMTAADYAFRGQLEPRPDGGMWILRDAGTVLRAGADGATAEFSIGDTWRRPAHDLDAGRGVRAHGQLGGLLRVGRDGAVSQGDFLLPPGPFELLDCEAGDLAAMPDGRLVVADYGCGRLVTTQLGGKVTARELARDEPVRAAGPRGRVAVVRRREPGTARRSAASPPTARSPASTSRGRRASSPRHRTARSGPPTTTPASSTASAATSSSGGRRRSSPVRCASRPTAACG